MKKGVLAAFLCFLAFMAVCTVIAKGIYRAELPRVNLCRPEKMSITHEISAVGSVQPGQELGVYAAENLRVQAVFVQAGDRVAAEDALFSVELQDLEEQLQEAEAEHRYLLAQLSDLAGQRQEQLQDKNTAAARLQADYDSLVREQDLKIRECELAAESLQRRMEQERQSVSGSDLEDGALALEYEQAVNRVEEAKLQKEEAVKNWRRSLEDAQEKDFAASAQTVKLQGDIARSELRMGKLKALKEQQGVIRAKEDGMILKGFLQAGERTPDGACLLYTALRGGGVETFMTEDDATLLSIGDSVNLEYKTATGEKKKCEGIIQYIDTAAGNGMWKLRVEPGDENLFPGQTVHMKTIVKSGAYETVIPQSALFSDGMGGYYVYVVEPYEGILGTEDRIRKIPVMPLEQNGSYAAVSAAALTRESAVVGGSSKELLENDIVRVVGD